MPDLTLDQILNGKINLFHKTRAAFNSDGEIVKQTEGKDIDAQLPSIGSIQESTSDDVDIARIPNVDKTWPEEKINENINKTTLQFFTAILDKTSKK